MAVATSMAILGGAALGLAGSVMSSRSQSRAATQAANTQAGANTAAQQMQMDYLERNRADIAKAVKAGVIDINSGYNAAIGASNVGFDNASNLIQPLTGIDELNTARGLLADPSSIMDRPSTQFQMEQGTEALQAAFSRTSGGGLSGAGIKAAQRFGQNLASTALDAELNRLFPFINLGVSARERLSDISIGRGTTEAELQAARGTSLANLKAGGATGTATIVGQAAPGIANQISTGGNIAAQGIINQENIKTGFTSNLANIGSQALNFAAVRPELFSGGGYSTPRGAFNPRDLRR